MGPLGIEAFRYNRWANLLLLDACSSLTHHQLELTAPGTYGTVASTFLHLLGAEQRYIRRLGGPEPTIHDADPFPGVDPLRIHAATSGDALIDLAGRLRPDETVERIEPGGTFLVEAGVILIQALHHGNDHRTHICTILGGNGLFVPDMDVWAYGRATGGIVPVNPSSSTGNSTR
jgi:uncharacterized damage-inducible protein DinB